MKGKKNRERFSIKFNENDPAHDAVIRLLEKQGPHSKAQFIVNAVLHYINCSEAPDIYYPQAVDRAVIEKIVMEILNQKEKGKPQNDKKGLQETVMDQGTKKTKINMTGEGLPKQMNQTTLALIADTMSAFRNC